MTSRCRLSRSITLLAALSVLLAGSCNGNEYCRTPAGASCGEWNNRDVCEGTAGCSWETTCNAVLCSSFTDEAKCQASGRCLWSSGQCFKQMAAPPCEAADAGACTALGCTWGPGCSGSLAPCEGRTASNCNAMPYSYCEWVKDTSPTQLY
jgi:hypothetical protein